MLVTVMTLLIAFFCAKAAFGDDRCAFTAAVTYGFSGYFAIDTYTRAAVGEFTAMAFFPLVLLGLYGIYTSDRPRFGDWLPMALGMAAMVQSHLLSCELTALLLILFCLLRLRETLRPARLLAWVKAALLAVGLSAWYLVPFFLSTSSIPFMVNGPLIGKIQFQGLYLIQLFNPFYNGFAGADAGTNPDMMLSLGLPLILGLGLVVFCLLRRRDAQGQDNIKNLAEDLKILLLPKDPNDERNVIVEIRGGAGGEESALFSAVLFRMYSMYAEKKGFKIEIINANETEIGGYKEISFMIEGEGAYSRFKYESGVHRVQRVPETESQGRVHTSTTTVAVLPEAEDVELEIDPNDLKIDTFRSSGAGGQHINKTSSAVRLTHIPTGVVTSCQTQRSQHQNRDYAMKMLKAKLVELAEQQQKEKISDIKGEQMDNGWGSQIRSYVFQPYTMVKDLRTGFEMGNIGAVMDGDLNGFINAYLKAASLGTLKK